VEYLRLNRLGEVNPVSVAALLRTIHRAGMFGCDVLYTLSIGGEVRMPDGHLYRRSGLGAWCEGCLHRNCLAP
jgi:hypothetical protein